MPSFEQVGHGLNGSAEVVRNDAVGVKVTCRPIDEHDCRPRAALLVQVSVILARRDDASPRAASLSRGPDQLALALGILVAATGEDKHPALARRVLDGAVKLRRK